METSADLQRFIFEPPFRPSYQGWKLCVVYDADVYTGLLDLPIRDGNEIGGRVTVQRVVLLDLPIRDGNFIELFSAK